jgi:osmotically-inducible protein OsmY
MMTERPDRQVDTDEYAAQQVRNTLALDGRGSELGVDVRVVGRHLYLGGSVASVEQREAVERVATENAGGRDVHSDIVVVATDEGGDEEDLR